MGSISNNLDGSFLQITNKLKEIYFYIGSLMYTVKYMIQDIQELKQVVKSITGEISNDPISTRWDCLTNKPYLYGKYVLNYHLPKYTVEKITMTGSDEIPTASTNGNIILYVDSTDFIKYPPVF